MALAKYLGVYSDTPAGKRSGGHAPRKQNWFVWDDLQGGYIVQPLNAAYNPTDEPRPISRAEFIVRFTAEDHLYVTPLTKPEVPDPPEKKRRVSPAPPAEERKEESAQRLAEAAKLDEAMRTEFALALAKLKRGDKASAINALERLVNRREGVIPAHKHTFTDFAVDLRKSKLPAVAFKFYERALELSPEDCNAYFNMARIMYDLGDYEGTEKHLQQALNLDVDFEYARQFLDYLIRHHKRGKNSKSMPDDDFGPMHIIDLE